MTQQEHDHLLFFSIKTFRNVFKNLSNLAIQEPLELFYNAYSKDPIDLKKQIVREIYDCYYISIGEYQKKQISKVFEKKCNHCNSYLDSTSFYEIYVKKYNLNILSAKCKNCISFFNSKKYNSDKLKEWYSNNRVEILKRQKIRRAHDEKYSKKLNNRAKRYRDDNPEKLAETRRKSYCSVVTIRRISTEWWETLSQETKNSYLEKHNFKNQNRDVRLFIFKNEKISYENAS